MKIVKTLTADQQLVVRGLQVVAQAAQIKMHEYRVQAEAEFKRLEQDASTKNQAVATHVENLAREAKLEIENLAFDFDKMAFHHPDAPVPTIPPSPSGD